MKFVVLSQKSCVSILLTQDFLFNIYELWHCIAMLGMALLSPPMRKLQPMGAVGTQMGTQLQKVDAATSPFLKESIYVVPPYPICITDFRVARPKMADPFRGAFKGIIFYVVL